MNRSRIVDDADITMRALKNPHIIVSLFRALDGLQPTMDRMEGIDSGTIHYEHTSRAVAAGRAALNEARGQA